MDQPFLIALLVALVVVLLALARIMTRPRPSAIETAGETSIGVSTEGMKLCPKCGMGNLWTERSCSGCGSALKG